MRKTYEKYENEEDLNFGKQKNYPSRRKSTFQAARTAKHTDDLPVTARTIYVERLYGKQETTDLYYKKERGVLTPPFLRQL